MTTISDVQTFSRALYETLINTAYKQLQVAAARLTSVSDSDPNLQQRIEQALPDTVLPAVRNFVLLLAQEGVLDQLGDIVQAFERYTQAGPQVINAEVISAVLLDQEQQKRITRELRQRYNTELDLHFHVDESLIGGLVIRVGDQVLDNSLRSRLGAIQRNMLTS